MKKGLFVASLLLSVSLIPFSLLISKNLNDSKKTKPEYYIQNSRGNSSENTLPDGYFYIEENYAYQFDKIYQNEVEIKSDGYVQLSIQEDYIEFPNNPFSGGEIVRSSNTINDVYFPYDTRILKSTDEGIYVEYLNISIVKLIIPFEGYAVDSSNLNYSIYSGNRKLKINKSTISFDYTYLTYNIELKIDNNGEFYNGTYFYYELGYKAKVFDGLLVRDSFIFGDENKFICIVSLYKQKEIAKKVNISVIKQKAGFSLIQSDELKANMKILKLETIL